MDEHDIAEVVRLMGRVLDLEERLQERVEQLDRRVQRVEKQLDLNHTYGNA